MIFSLMALFLSCSKNNVSSNDQDISDLLDCGIDTTFSLPLPAVDIARYSDCRYILAGNYGTEILLSADIIREENLSWNVTGTFANNKNEIVALYGEVDEFGNLMDDVSRERFIGHPINVIYQYAFDGIWQVGDDIANSHMPDAQPGDIRVRDVSGPNGVPDGELTADDKIIINQDPDWFGSISSSLKYKQFELFTDFYFVQGAKKSNSYLAAYEDGGTLQGNFNGIKVDYYTPENPSNTYPRPNRTTPSFLYALAVQDASFIKLRTLQLSYHMPESVVSFLNLDSFKIYASATNLITLTDYKSYNPEVNPGAYPDGREITVGIKSVSYTHLTLPTKA